MTHASDPKRPKKPVLPSQPDVRQRPNEPIGPSGEDKDLLMETPPEEIERDQDPRSRDPL